MKNNQIPSKSDLRKIARRLGEHEGASNVRVETVLKVYSETDDYESRMRMYELESELLNEFPHIRFDFRTTVPQPF